MITKTRFLILALLLLIQGCVFNFRQTSSPILDAQSAIKAIQENYSEVRNIEPVLTPTFNSTSLIKVIEKNEGWDIVFYQGEGDCPSGCINSYFWYFSVDTDGTIKKIGEYSRVFYPKVNGYKENGSPMWGFPK